MALSKAMEEMLSTMKDEKAREVFRVQLEADPAVRDHFEGNLRQSDYDRQMNANKAEVERLKGLEETAKKWEKWAADNVPKHEKLVTDMAAREAELAELKAKQGGGGNGNNGGDNNNRDYTGLTSEEIIKKVNAEIASKGFISKSDLEASLKAAAEAERKSFMETTFPSTMAWQNAMIELQFQHRDEFKKPLDPLAFSKFLVEKKISDPKQGYEMFVAEDRGKLHEARLREEIEKDLRSKMGLPGTGAPPAPEMGPLQLRLQGKPPVDIPEGTSPGDGRMASLAAQELRTEGKF
jgi:hypothetical protein